MYAFPPLEGERARRDGIAGEIARQAVALEVAPGHHVACHLYDPRIMNAREEPRAIAAD